MDGLVLTSVRGGAQVKVFELEDVSFGYLSGSPVLEKVNLAVEQGRFLAVVGPNGAGKSTLLKICVGLLRPDSGQVKIFQTPLGQFKDWAKVAYIAQQTTRERHFPATVEEVVAMGRVAPTGVGGRLKSSDYALTAEAIRVVGLQDLQKRMIGELSGGQQQRVVIAKALAAQPEILVLDEAASGIDTAARESLYTLLKAINRDTGTSIMMVSHDVERIAQYADDIAGIDGGVAYYGTAAAFQGSCNIPAHSWAGKNGWRNSHV